MSKYYGYIRVSTVKQGEGVSLQEQKESITRYAHSRNFEIIEWFEEKMTAAKGGRPKFTLMLNKLRRNAVNGVIIHKIDRSARNLKDWSNLGELIDSGLDIHFANESLDLNSRGGRLSADIQAVVAADYIRNLREESKKGFYGRIKQGLFPLPAPIGYVDCGKGKPKEIDPKVAPLVKKAFELYSTGEYSLKSLTKKMYEIGLRNKNGNRIDFQSISKMLNNPFYIGLIQLRRENEIHQGVHAPLIRKAMFDRVQLILKGKLVKRVQKHNFIFRKLLKCKSCGYSLIGEKQKGHIYYRCHIKECPTTTIREEEIEQIFLSRLESIKIKPKLKRTFFDFLIKNRVDLIKQRESSIFSLESQLNQVTERLNRITDAFLDGAIEKELYVERKNSMMTQKKDFSERLEQLHSISLEIPDEIKNIIEHAETLALTYNKGEIEDKRELVKILTSNRIVDGKKIDFILNKPYSTLSELTNTYNCVPGGNRTPITGSANPRPIH